MVILNLLGEIVIYLCCCVMELRIWKNWLMDFDLEFLEMEFIFVKVVFMNCDVDDRLFGRLMVFMLWLYMLNLRVLEKLFCGGFVDRCMKLLRVNVWMLKVGLLVRILIGLLYIFRFFVMFFMVIDVV